jgi:hypothetical protein
MTDEKMQPNLYEQLEQTKPLLACSLSSSRLWTQVVINVIDLDQMYSPHTR